MVYTAAWGLRRGDEAPSAAELQKECALSFDATTLAWIGVVLMIVVGLAGTVLPALPGTLFVLGGVIWGAWLDGFTKVPVWVVVICAVLAAIALATDYVAAALGAKKVRASTWAIVGAALGTVAGIFTGFVGLLFMPLLGAVAGEWFAQRQKTADLQVDASQYHVRAAKVGLATWVGILVGTAVKLALVLTIVGIFAAAYWL
jgi:uncharacterized protein